jgi:toxin ParE1/3/4
MIMWLDDAVQDLRSLHQHITLENPLAANRVAKRILNAVNMLIEQPAMGRQGRVHNTRELIVSGSPFIIPYRVKNKNVEILRVFHSAMQWPEEI